MSVDQSKTCASESDIDDAGTQQVIIRAPQHSLLLTMPDELLLMIHHFVTYEKPVNGEVSSQSDATAASSLAFALSCKHLYNISGYKARKWDLDPDEKPNTVKVIESFLGDEYRRPLIDDLNVPWVDGVDMNWKFLKVSVYHSFLWTEEYALLQRIHCYRGWKTISNHFKMHTRTTNPLNWVVPRPSGMGKDWYKRVERNLACGLLPLQVERIGKYRVPTTVARTTEPKHVAAFDIALYNRGLNGSLKRTEIPLGGEAAKLALKGFIYEIRDIVRVGLLEI